MTVKAYGWVRQRYVVVENALCPVPDAALEHYCPWQMHSRETLGEARFWYLDLAGVDTSDPASIEGTVSRWGLLGLYSHAMVQARTNSPATTRGRPGSIRYERPGPGWGRSVTHCSQHQTPVEMSVQGSLFSAAEVGLPEVVLIERPDGILYEERLRDYARRFVRDLAGPLLPSMPGFWENAVEPVEDYRAAIVEFQRTFDACLEIEERGGKQQEWADLWERQAYHLRRVGPMVIMNPVAHQICTFPSLLSVAYLCLFVDATTPGRFLRRCKNRTCQRPFVTTHPRRESCSGKCRNTETQRRLRGA